MKHCLAQTFKSKYGIQDENTEYFQCVTYSEYNFCNTYSECFFWQSGNLQSSNINDNGFKFGKILKTFSNIEQNKYTYLICELICMSKEI